MNRTGSIRAYKEGDEDEIFELTKVVWREQVPEKERWMKGWRWMHIDNPAGISRIWLAEIDGKLVGQYPLIPEDLKVSGKIVKGAQIVDTMTHPEYRRQKLAYSLGKKALKELEKEKIHLVYGFPNQQAYPLHMKSGWLDVCPFQVMVKPLNLKNFLQQYIIRNRLLLNISASGVNLIIKAFFRSKKVPEQDMSKIREITSFDDRINEFWNIVSCDYNVIRIRDKRYLNWRYVDVPNSDYTLYVAEEEEEVVGYIVLGCGNANGLTWGHICDIIALTGRVDIIQCLIAKAVEHLKAKEVDVIFCQMIADKNYRKGFLMSGFIPHLQFKSRFIAYNASSKLSNAFIKNQNNWFIRQGDLPGVY